MHIAKATCGTAKKGGGGTNDDNLCHYLNGLQRGSGFHPNEDMGK